MESRRLSIFRGGKPNPGKPDMKIDPPKAEWFRLALSFFL